MGRRKERIKEFSARLADGETIQRIITVTDDMLKTIIMMSSTLLAIGVIFDDFVKSPLVRVVIILMFFLGLIISFLGVLPFDIRYDIEDAEELRQQRAGIFLRKRRHLWFGASAIALGFVMVIIDLIMDLISNWNLS